jgi:MFS family permease
MLWFTLFFNQQAIGYITTMYKPFGQTFIADDRFMAVVASLMSVFNSAGRVFWGWLADKTCYRVSQTLTVAEVCQ